MVHVADERINDLAILIANAERARALLEWAPSYSIEGIIEMA